MDGRLRQLITAYQRAVAECVGLLVAIGAPRPKSTSDWTTADFPGRGKFPDGREYFVHGIGCAIRSRTATVDFDFGDRGEINGFDESRLVSFLGTNPQEHGFATHDEMRQCFRKAKDDGEFAFSGYILYYLKDGSSSVGQAVP